MQILRYLVVYEIRRRNAVGDLNITWSRFDEICWPENESRSTNTVIIFSIHCFMSDCKCIIWHKIDAICCVATR
jgi:hypothetical protein